MAGHRTPSARELISKLARLIASDSRDLWMIVVYSIVVGVLALGVPIGAQMLFNYVAFGALLQPLVLLAVVLLVVLTVAGVMRSIISFLVEMIQRRLFVRVVGRLGERLPKVRADAFDRAEGTDLVNRFFDVMTIQKVGATLLLDGIAAVLQMLIGLLIVAFYHPFLLGFAIVLLIAVMIVVFILGRSGARTAITESTAKYATAATLESIVTEPILFKQADGAGLAHRLVNERIEKYLEARRAHFRVYFRQVIAAFGVQVIAATALLTIGGYLVIVEQLSLGQLVAAELIITIALSSLTKFALKFDDIYDMLAGVYKLEGLLELPRERTDGQDHIASDGPASLLAVDLSFEYEDGPRVFSGLSLAIASGERVAVVSDQADGKTTLAELIFGIRTPTGGHIEVDGIDIRELSLDVLRHRVALAEGTEIIRGTIGHNVSLGRPEADEEQCRAALERVGLLSELREMPGGLNTELTPGGAILSTGQCQRMTIARAIAGCPGVLIVDGLLDGLDAETRAKVIAGLTDPDWPCTVLFLGTHDWYSESGTRVIDFGGTFGRTQGGAERNTGGEQ